MNSIVTFHPNSIKNVEGNSPVFFNEVVLNDTGHVYNVVENAVFPRQISSAFSFHPLITAKLVTSNIHIRLAMPPGSGTTWAVAGALF